MLGSLGAKYLPGLGFKPVQPKTIQALYLPTWFVEAKVSGNFSNGKGKERELHVHFMNSYMPGFRYDVLSMLPFPEESMYTIAVPFTPELKTQHGTDITCLPYTISPLSLEKYSQSLSRSQTMVQDNLRFTAASFHFDTLVAYPVLLPIYLAEYEYTFGSESPSPCLCIIQAHSNKGISYLELPYPERAKKFIRTVLRHQPSDTEDYWIVLNGKPFLTVGGSTATFANIKTVVFPPGASEKTLGPVAEILQTWLDHNLLVHGLEGLTKFGVDMNDPRVREYTREEISINRTWIISGLALAIQRGTSDMFTRSSRSKLDNPEDLKKIDAIEQYFHSEMRRLQEKRQAMAPKWLNELEAFQAKGKASEQRPKKIG